MTPQEKFMRDFDHRNDDVVDMEDILIGFLLLMTFGFILACVAIVLR